MTRPSRTSLVNLVALAALGLLTACAPDDGPALSAEGERGHELAANNGCVACHGPNGQGGVGPAWVGLAGSTVTLEDGTTLTADDAYLARAIAEPEADLVDGYTLQMPPNNLEPDEVDAIVAYIKELQ